MVILVSRWVRPLRAGIGATPHRCADAASERSRSGLSPAVMSICPVTSVPTPGSVARGQETPNSDIDLLVDLRMDTGLFPLVALRGELERLLEARIDLVPADSLKGRVRQDVLRDAVNL